MADKKQGVTNNHCFNCDNYWQGDQGVNCCNLVCKTAFIARKNMVDQNGNCINFELKTLKQ